MASCCLCFVRHVSSLTGRLVPCVIVPVSSYRNGRCCCCHLAEPQTLIEAPTTTTMSSNINFLFWYKRTDGPQLFFRIHFAERANSHCVCVAAAEFFFLRQRQRATLDVFIKRKFMSVRPSVGSFFSERVRAFLLVKTGRLAPCSHFRFSFPVKKKKKESATVKQITLGW